MAETRSPCGGLLVPTGLSVRRMSEICPQKSFGLCIKKPKVTARYEGNVKTGTSRRPKTRRLSEGRIFQIGSVCRSESTSRQKFRARSFRLSAVRKDSQGNCVPLSGALSPYFLSPRRESMACGAAAGTGKSEKWWANPQSHPSLSHPRNPRFPLTYRKIGL